MYCAATCAASACYQLVKYDEPDELEYEQMDLEQQEQMDEELEELEQLELELASNQLANNRRWDFPEMAHLSIARSLRTESAPDRLETVPYLVIPAAQPSTSTEPVSTALTVLTETALTEIPATQSVQPSTSGISTAPKKRGRPPGSKNKKQ